MLAIVLTVIGVCAANLGAIALFVWWSARQDAREAEQAEELRVMRQLAADPAVFAAVKQAAIDVGLNGDAITRDFDLLCTGKLIDVQHHAAATLGKNPEQRTVGDVVDWLAEAPDR